MKDSKQKANFNKLYSKLLPSIKKIYTNYNFLDISKENFEKLTYELLEEIYNKNNMQNEDNSIYFNKLKKYLDVYVQIRI